MCQFIIMAAQVLFMELLLFPINLVGKWIIAQGNGNVNRYFLLSLVTGQVIRAVLFLPGFDKREKRRCTDIPDISGAKSQTHRRILILSGTAVIKMKSCDGTVTTDPGSEREKFGKTAR